MKTTALLCVAVLSVLPLLGSVGCKDDQHGSMATGQMKQGAEHTMGDHAMVTLKPAANQMGTANASIMGSIHIWTAANVTTFSVQISGLQPNSTHGFHVHEKGDLSAPDLSSAGGHWDPKMTHQHGGPMDMNNHAGDLGNVVADANGMVNTTITRSDIQTKDLIGKSIILHEKTDDLKTNPSGNSGGRIAGGIIRPQ